MYKLEEYRNIVKDMVRADADRDAKFLEVDEAHNVKYKLPPAWSNIPWIRAYPTTKPADLIDAAVRALSTKSPQLTVVPLLQTDIMKVKYDLLERGLTWHWKQIEKRSQSNPTKAIVQSAIKYDEVTAQLVYLPYQNKLLKNINSKSSVRARSYGPFSVVVHNPRNVHVQYSDMMPERVALVKRLPYHKVIDFWGKNAEELRKKVEGDGHTALTDLCDIYDYWDGEIHTVYVEPVMSGDFSVIIEPQEHGLGFLPWSCRVGGSSLDESAADQRRPLLNSLVNGGLIETTNHLRSLFISLVMARATEPTKVSKTPTGDGVEVDATEAIAQYKLKAGEEMTTIPPGEISSSVLNVYQMLGADMEQGTGMSLLMQNNAPSGMAFATYNAVIQAGMSAINPHKQIAERSIADLFTLMVSYLKHSGDSLMSYDDRKSNTVDGSYTLGTQELVSADEIPDAENFYADVKLTEYVPSDDMGKANSAAMLTQQMKLPVARGMGMLDIADPQTALKEWAEEQKTFASVQIDIDRMKFEEQMMQQRMMAKLQAELQQPQQQQIQQEEGGDMLPPGTPGSQSPMGIPDPMMEQAFQGIEGEGFAGNMGGSSPLAAAPYMTGVGLPAIEGRDNRGLRMPPEGRAPVE
jgi:hypothetical protein